MLSPVVSFCLPETNTSHSHLGAPHALTTNQNPSAAPQSPQPVVLNTKMGDTANLRSLLSQTDMSQPAIQSSAAAMMKFYDKNAAPLAVSEWRSQLQSCRPDQLLPLLYVANEVLQTSKRNRCPKFLEAFAEVLGSSLRFICERDRSIVEKVRRTAKIWGDRQVYSPRFNWAAPRWLGRFAGRRRRYQ